jgi:FtsP/CotA-like multicopper oxidase with cupredoxin domain
MFNAFKNCTRLAAAADLTAACLAIALVAPHAVAKDVDDDRGDGGGRRCRGLSSEASVDRSAFPQPQVRRSSHGRLRTVLHGCIATNNVMDPLTGETRRIKTPTFEGTIPGPTLSVEPGDKLSILLINDLPANPTNER